MQGSSVDCSLDRLVLANMRASAEAPDDDRTRLARLRCGFRSFGRTVHVLLQLARVLRLGGSRVDAEVHHDLRAERLAQLDAALEAPLRGSVRHERDVLDVLRADAENHA